jgi:hypothetical protein
MSRFPRLSKTEILHGMIVVVVVLAALALWRIGRTNRTPPVSEAGPTVAPVAAPAAPPMPAKTEPVAGNPVETFEWFQKRPFEVARESGTNQWTAEDGRNPDAILNLAHNDLEVQRLMDENARINRRQLVYRKEPAWVLVERAKATGEPVRKLTLPAFDGQEVEVEVTNTDLAPSGLSGTFAGRLAGRGQSLVTLAFNQGREALR